MRDPALRRSLGTTFADGLRRGAKGAVIDMQVFSRRWDFAVESINCPTRVWIGTADRNVSVKAACQLAERAPNGSLIRLPDQGHFWAAQHVDIVLAWLDQTDAEARQPAGVALRVK